MLLAGSVAGSVLKRGTWAKLVGKCLACTHLKCLLARTPAKAKTFAPSQLIAEHAFITEEIYPTLVTRPWPMRHRVDQVWPQTGPHLPHAEMAEYAAHVGGPHEIPKS